jgi:citrate synthase
MFTVLFAIPRTVGWLAQWNELMADSEQKISRPRQVYLGEGHRKVMTHSKAADAIAVKHKDTVVAG